MALKIIQTGSWLYGGTVEMPVDIIGLDYDWHFESSKGAGVLKDGEAPMSVDERGLIYYVRFRHAGEITEPTWVDTDGFPNAEDAMSIAESRVPGGIMWW